MTRKLTTCTPRLASVGRLGWLVLMALLFVPSLRAQETMTLLEQAETDSLGHRTYGTFQKPIFAIGLSSGTQAFIGLDITASVARRLNLRAGFNLLSFTLDDYRLNASSFGFTDQVFLLDITTNLSTIGLLADYAINNQGNLRVMGGALFGLGNQIKVDGRLERSIFINDFELSPERVGAVGGTYTNKFPVYPYLGVGIGRTVPKRRLALNMEIGAFLRGDPQVEVRSSGLLADNEHNGPILSDNLAELSLPLSWHPNFSLRLSYRLDPPPSIAKPVATGEPVAGPSAGDAPMPAEVAPVPTGSVTAPDAYPYITYEAVVVDVDTKEPLDYIYVDIFKMLPGGTKELERTGRYPGGTFRVGLEKGFNYEFIFTHSNYGEQKETLQVPQNLTETVQQQKFFLQAK